MSTGKNPSLSLCFFDLNEIHLYYIYFAYPEELLNMKQATLKNATNPIYSG